MAEEVLHVDRAVLQIGDVKYKVERNRSAFTSRNCHASSWPASLWAPSSASKFGDPASSLLLWYKERQSLGGGGGLRHCLPLHLLLVGRRPV